MKIQPFFSFSTQVKSICHALDGLRIAIMSQKNLRFHLLATVGVLVVTLIIRVSLPEAIALSIVTGMVWMAELFNTAIEQICDFVCGEKRIAIKHIKDIAAAAVLVTATSAFLTACFIFIPKL